MAIDTENKRASAANHFLFQILPAPDALPGSKQDRAHLFVYCGVDTISDWKTVTIQGIEVVSGRVVFIKGQIRF